MANRTAQQRVASAFLNRLGFNKYNAPELLGQLLKVLQDNNLDEAVTFMKDKRVTQIVDKAWREREK